MVTKMLMLSCLMRMLVTTNCLVLNPIPEPPYLTRPRRGSECVISTLSRPQERVQDSGIGNLLVAQRKVICTPVMYLCSQSTDSPIPSPQPEESDRAGRQQLTPDSSAQAQLWERLRGRRPGKVDNRIQECQVSGGGERAGRQQLTPDSSAQAQLWERLRVRRPRKVDNRIQ